MSFAEASLLLRAVRSPQDLRELTNPQWDLLLRLLWKCRLIGRVALSCDAVGITDSLPQKVQQQFESALVLIDKQRQMVTWEANRVGWALQGLEVPVVLLKGAAYMLSDFEFERGRLFADVDVMVPADDLARVEERLKQRGWRFIELNAYDERYYRVWSHELPPMRHFEREVELDVHHTILPLTSRLTPDREKLWERTQAATRNSVPNARPGGHGPAQRCPPVSRRGSHGCGSRHTGSRWSNAPLFQAAGILGHTDAARRRVGSRTSALLRPALLQPVPGHPGAGPRHGQLE